MSSGGHGVILHQKAFLFKTNMCYSVINNSEMSALSRGKINQSVGQHL